LNDPRRESKLEGIGKGTETKKRGFTAGKKSWVDEKKKKLTQAFKKFHHEGGEKMEKNEQGDESKKKSKERGLGKGKGTCVVSKGKGSFKKSGKTLRWQKGE